MKIGLTSVYVNNTEDAFRFYTEILGFIEILHMPESNLAIVASPQDPKGTSLLLEPNDSSFARKYQEKLYNSKLPTIVFTSDNIHKEYERLVDKGVDFIKKPTETEWGILAIFDDSCGNFVQLHQPA
ncbi:MAG: VOC family protein [Bacteroidales bacterium]|nr:VOC family protein [Bacteroidales bacterium]